MQHNKDQKNVKKEYFEREKCFFVPCKLRFARRNGIDGNGNENRARISVRKGNIRQRKGQRERGGDGGRVRGILKEHECLLPGKRA